MLNYIEQLVMNNWLVWFANTSHPRNLRFLTITRGHILLLFIFADESPLPALLVKIPRNNLERTSLQREYAHLQKVHAMVSPTLKATILTPLFMEEIGSDLIRVEKVFPGYPVVSINTPTGQNVSKLTQRQKEAAQEWLFALHKQTVTTRIPFGRNDIFSATLTSLEAMRQYYTLSPEEEILINHLYDQATELSDQYLPLVCQHGDFWTGNILWQGCQISGVVDWEYSKFNALPFFDLFLFIQDTSRARFNDNSLQQNTFIQTYFEHLEIDTRFITLFWPISLAVMATRKCCTTAKSPTYSDRYFRRKFGWYAKDRS